jgi:hypothetical protein
MPEENTVIAAKVMALNAAGLLVEPQLQVLRHAAGAAAVVERHHEDAHEDHRGYGAHPVEVRRHDAVLRPGGAHPDHFLRAQVGRQKREAGDPHRHGAAGGEEVRAGSDTPLQQPADAEYEGEVQTEDEVVR